MCARLRLLLFTGVSVVSFIGTAVGDCSLPPHPSHGRHQPQGSDCGGADKPPACDGTPGTRAPEDWLLTVRCDPGYKLADPGGADVISVCTNGVWSIPQLPPCIIPDLLANDRERCTVPEPPPNSQTRLLAEECGGDNLGPGSVVPHDCILFLNCAPGYRRQSFAGDLFHCANKTWNPPIPDDLCIKAVDTGTQVQSSVSPPVVSATGCVLPNSNQEVPTRKFCSLAPGCEDCDFYNSRCHVPSGSRVDKVKVVCPLGYIIKTNEIAFCVTSGWYKPVPECLKLCRPLRSDALVLTCKYGSDSVSCSNMARPGTKVSFQCQPSFLEYPDLKRQGAYRNIIECRQSGEWSDNLPPCKPGCGVSKEVKKFSPTVVDGINANVGFFPWHAGLYSRMDNGGKISWAQTCGGSLITARVIITAAHCVYGVTDVNNVRVALGKYHRSWDIREHTEAKRNVSEIALSPQYNSNTFTFDLALVLLSEKIKFGEYIMPVCRDYNEGTNQLQNSKLYVVGWGKISSDLNAQSSENLLYNTVTVMPEKVCKQELPVYFSTFEKFCAVKNNSDSITQKGDSGGGLTVVYEDGLHYIVGIVSTKLGEVSMFTNIKWKIHSEWIDSKIRQFTEIHGN